MDAPTLQQVAAKYRASEVTGAWARWHFARALVLFVAANPTITYARIGAACAKAVDAEKPFSRAWVCRALAAGKAFESEPKTAADASRFLRAFHGHSENRSASAKGNNATAQHALKHAIDSAVLATERGMTPATVEAAIHHALAQTKQRTASAT